MNHKLVHGDWSNVIPRVINLRHLKDYSLKLRFREGQNLREIRSLYAIYEAQKLE